MLPRAGNGCEGRALTYLFQKGREEVRVSSCQTNMAMPWSLVIYVMSVGRRHRPATYRVINVAEPRKEET
ncbi:hypothetical protein OPV22_005820 [Ensete ventricosum]|uniref:Uncharacterized protein n=1 Tax=Ensete ventricosum TaxID=4639 RepID=A0AAV8RRP8_ENSVE|nr:hypothetical protein OPV22_005820 [Ensete ventricosum]